MHQNSEAPLPIIKATDVSMQNLNIGLEQPGQFQTQLQVGLDGYVDVTGHVTLQPWYLDAQSTLQNITLADWQPLLMADSALQLNGGIFSGNAAIKMSEYWLLEAAGKVTELTVQQDTYTLLELAQASVGSAILDAQNKSITVNCLVADNMQGQIPPDSKTISTEKSNNDTWRVIIANTPLSQTDDAASCSLSDLQQPQ